MNNVVELKKELNLSYESLRYLEEKITDPIWDLLYEQFEELPKQAKIELTLKFTRM